MHQTDHRIHHPTLQMFIPATSVYSLYLIRVCLMSQRPVFTQLTSAPCTLKHLVHVLIDHPVVWRSKSLEQTGIIFEFSYASLSEYEILNIFVMPSHSPPPPAFRCALGMYAMTL